jgi:DNA-binding NtrC family response regulator
MGVETLPPRLVQGAEANRLGASDSAVGARDDPGEAGGSSRGPAGVGDASSSVEQPYRKAREIALSDFERRYFTRLLRRTEGNLSEAARLAGLDRSNLRRALARLGMRPEEWRGQGSRQP